VAVAVKPGDEMPEVAGPTQAGTRLSTRQFLGKWLVLYFYPKDNTPGCTREARAFDAILEALRERDAEVVGVSVDSEASHRRFADACGLRFPLISDHDRSISRQLDVLNERGTSARRVTFLIDPEGRVAHVFEDVKVDGHAEEVLRTLDRLREARAQAARKE